ncbi:MAG: hypothetical protein ACRDVN_09180 [Jiangellaceae bacterium]
MRHRPPTRSLIAVLVAVLVVGNAAQSAAAQGRPFEPRFEQRVTGDISIVSGRDAATATASRPAGSTLLFAGLYWGGRLPTDPATAGQVTVRIGSRTPAAVVADRFDTEPYGFGAVADVTDLFAGTGPWVDLTVADGGSSRWSLVTAWSSPLEPLRDLRVVDGLVDATGAQPATATVSGLSTPRRGPVDTTVAVVTHDDPAEATAEVDAGQRSMSVPVRPVGSDALVAAVTTASEAAAVTDLGVDTTISPAADAGNVVVTVTVANHGPDDQTGPAIVTVRPHAGLDPDAVSLASTGGACGLAVFRAVCALDPLAAGRDAAVTFTATVTAEAGTALVADAQALTPQSDVDPVATNDTAEAVLAPSTIPDDVTEASRPVHALSDDHSEPDPDAP